MVEHWNTIPGHDGYEASDAGRVRRIATGASMSEQWTTGGHMYVQLGRGARMYVSRAVLSAFVGPCPDGQRAMHLDGDPSDNRLCNLAWAPRTSSARRGARHQKWAERGVFKASNGYLVMRLGRDHPLADPNGYCRVHVVVWVSAGRPWPVAGGHIHHVNGDKTDNRIENLTMLDEHDHARVHAAMRKHQHLALPWVTP